MLIWPSQSETIVPQKKEGNGGSIAYHAKSVCFLICGCLYIYCIRFTFTSYNISLASWRRKQGYWWHLLSGGEPLVAADTAALAAAREAESGAWLLELENSDILPQVLAPGMKTGAFKSWDPERMLLTKQPPSKIRKTFSRCTPRISFGESTARMTMKK